MYHLQHLFAVLDDRGAQGFMTANQGIERTLQRRHIQWPAQAQGTGNVVRRAIWIKVPEEPLTLLGEGKQQRFISATLENRYYCKEVNALLLEQHRQRFPLLYREASNRFDQRLHPKLLTSAVW